MEHDEIGIWAKGYIDALMTGGKVSKEQLEILIRRINELIKSYEDYHLNHQIYKLKEEVHNLKNNKTIGGDDLPF